MSRILKIKSIFHLDTASSDGNAETTTSKDNKQISAEVINDAFKIQFHCFAAT